MLPAVFLHLCTFTTFPPRHHISFLPNNIASAMHLTSLLFLAHIIEIRSETTLKLDHASAASNVYSCQYSCHLQEPG